MKTVLVVAAHPDDEVLGCGATIAKLADDGWAVHVLIAAEGVTSRDAQRNTDANLEKLSELKQCAYKANSILGVATVNFLSLPDNRMDSCELLDITKMIEHYISEIKPSMVFTHHIGDVNIDHQILHNAVITACRPLPDFPVKKILFFEVPSSTEWRPVSTNDFVPNYFSDITHYLEKKLAALNEYSSEMRDFPHPRSLEAVLHLARWRGASVGCHASEAFILGREII